MGRKQSLGRDGEAMAAKWLQEKGFTILHQNWRHAHYEVDLIASKDNVLHFIEVKTRRTKTFGTPEEAINHRKMATLLKAGEAYQFAFPGFTRVQYDALSITLDDDQSATYFFIEDFYL